MKIQCIPLGSIGANFYIVTDEDTNETFVIDPGAEPEKVCSLIKNLCSDLKYIIITHAHADHIGALDKLKEEFDVPVVLQKNDSDSLNSSVWNLCTNFGIESPNTKADIIVNDGDTLPFGKSQIKFIHTPGHTKGSMCVLIKDYLFSGDTLFYHSIGRSDFIGGSYEELMDSIHNKIFTLDENITVYPGHGEKTTILNEKANNPFC